MMDSTGGYTRLGEEGFDAVHEILGHVAHDFGNLVTPLLAYPELIKDELENGSFAWGLVEQIQKTAGDMARITQQLQMLSKREEKDCEPIDLSQLVSDVVKRMRAGDKPVRMEIELSLAEEPLLMQGNVLQLTAAVHALCLNAIESMPGGGGVTVATARVTGEPRVTGSGIPVEARSYLQVAVSDRGTGVPGHIRDSIFAPFVTSKNSSEKRGAGLGLTVAYKAARDHGGYIDFNPRPEGGTLFSLGLPD